MRKKIKLYTIIFISALIFSNLFMIGIMKNTNTKVERIKWNCLSVGGDEICYTSLCTPEQIKFFVEIDGVVYDDFSGCVIERRL